MALYPKAIKRLIPPGSSDPRITPRVAILHVDAGNADTLYYFFRDRSGGIESHFYVKTNGVVEQYRDTNYQADANYKANDFAISIETQGYGEGQWNNLQLNAIKELLLWLHQTHRIPLEKCPTWNGSGIGYHTLFGAPSPWTPVAKSCPGPKRKLQFEGILVPWMRSLTQPRIANMPQLTITTFNIWRENPNPGASLTKVTAAKPHIVGLNESKHAHHVASALDGYRAVVEGSKQNIVLVRKDLKVVSSREVKMCEKVGTSPARYATEVIYNFKGRTRVHIQTHANAHVQGPGGIPRALNRVTQYAAHMKNLVKLVREHRKAGRYGITVGGDLNWHYGVGSWAWSPAPVLKLVRLKPNWAHRSAPEGGTAKNDRKIDYLAHSPKDLRVQSQRLISTTSDHKALEVTYRVNL